MKSKIRENLDELLTRVRDILDNDLYKFTMMWAVIDHFPNAKVKYELIIRGDTKFPEGFASNLRKMVDNYRNSMIDEKTKKAISKKCPYLPHVFLDFLVGFTLDPSEVGITQEEDIIKVSIEGYWYRTILWEVLLMSDISELYYTMMDISPNTTVGVINDKDSKKATIFNMHNMKYADFGTRRRYSYKNHERIVKILKEYSPRNFIGTSNLKLALKYDLKAIGTFAHEWVSGVGALLGYAHANQHAMELWSQTYGGVLGIALPDTFGIGAFLNDFSVKYAKLFDGSRHDSGDPFKYIDVLTNHYNKSCVDPLTKTIVFSNALDQPLAIKLNDACRNKIKTSFGIGTNITNDLPGVIPINMVIKLIQINGLHVIKLSDDDGKNTGDKQTIKTVKELIGYKPLSKF